MKKFLCSLLAIVMLAGMFAGCAGTPKAEGIIKIGGIGPATGGAAIYGSAVKNGAQIAVDEINALDEALKIEFNFQDDENDAEKSVNAYNSLKDWGMQILMGTVTTTPGIAVSSEAFGDRIFALTPSASSTDVIGGQPDENGTIQIPRKDNVFQMCFTDPNQGIASADYISQQKLGEKIAVIYNNSDTYSKGIYEKFASRAKTLGLNIVSTTSFTDDTATDFSVQLTDAKNAGADLVFLPIYYAPASLILTQAKSMKYAPKFFGCDGLDGLVSLENFDASLAEGVMLLTPFVADADDERTKSFVLKYKTAYGETPNQFAADGYDCIYAIYEACKKAGISSSMDVSEICEKLVATFTDAAFKFDGLTGNGMQWSTAGEVSKSPKGMVINKGVYVGM